ncbi:MAG: hypothetical protein AB7G06_10000 [Bdellovibrionales bacterium]
MQFQTILFLAALLTVSPACSQDFSDEPCDNGVYSGDPEQDSWREEVPIIRKEEEEYFKSLQSAFSTNDKDRILDQMDWPVEGLANGQYFAIFSRQEFIEHYDKLLTPALQKAIAQSTTKDLVRNYCGVSINYGLLVFHNIELDEAARPDYKIKLLLSVEDSKLSKPNAIERWEAVHKHMTHYGMEHYSKITPAE